MSIRQLSFAALVAVAFSGCAGGSPAGTSTLPAKTAVPATTAATTAPSLSVAPASAPTVSSAAGTPPAAGGGATDFCSAYAEYKAANDAATPQEQGAGYRTAATDIRAFAPAEITAAAGLFADVLDEVGQALAAGQPNPETIGSGQSAERRQGIADTITWVNANCP